MSVAPTPHLSIQRPASVAGLTPLVRRAAPLLGPLIAGAARGLAIGLLVVALACGAIAAQALHAGPRVVDWALGMALTALPVLLVFAVLSVSSAIVARLLGRLSCHGPRRLRRIARAMIPTVRFCGRFLVASTIVVPVLVWSGVTDGLIGMYHSLFYFEIPIAIGALVGLLTGVAMATRGLAVSARRARAVAVGAGVPALVVAVAVGAWVILPGAGDAIVREDPRTMAAIPQLQLPDPSQPGPFTVASATYGSGSDARRPEFGSDVDWITPSVDASAALGGRGDLDTAYAEWFWGFDASRLPLNARVWYPVDATGRLPVVLIAHGNHDAGDYSDPGYTYLAEHLASRGFIAASVDENYLNGDAFFDYSGAEMGTRAWLLLRHLDLLRVWDSTPGHPLAGRVDLDRVGLIGHSRGGEAAALAAVLEADAASSLHGLPPIPRGFGIRAVVAFAPSDGMWTGTGSPIELRDVDYLVLQGAHDGDLPGFTGLKTFHRATFETGGHLKVALFSERANHGRFNSVWNDADAGALQSWTLDRGSLLSADEQQRLARAAVGAFLARSVLGQTAYDGFFREPRAGRGWLPDDVVETHWVSSDRIVVADFAPAEVEPAGGLVSGFTVSGYADPPLRDGATQGDRSAWLAWTAPASYSVAVAAASAARLDPSASLVFSMTASVDRSAVLDPLIELRSVDGRVASIRLSSVAPGRPQLPTRIRKWEILADRYEPNEKRALPAERFMQTYDVPLAAFDTGATGFDAASLAVVTFRFDAPGAIYLDDIGFEPHVRT